MARRRARSGSSWMEFILYAVFSVVTVAGLVGGGLYATGFFDGPSAPSREGQIACPALARPVEVYSVIGRNDLIDPATGQLNVRWIPETAGETVTRDLREILGRVLKRDRAAGSVLSESDFFPAGTRPGLAAGIPPGMRAVSIETDRIDGLSLLHMGDRFDLYASLPSDPDIVPPSEYAVLLGGIKPPDTRAGQLAKQTGVRTLVSGGQMIALTKGTSRSTEGQQGLVTTPNPRAREVQKTVATIGVAPEEVTPLTEALGLDGRIVCVTHSGRSDDETTSPIPEIDLDGRVPIAAPFRGVDAFSAISQGDLVDPVSGRLNNYYFEPGQVNNAWLESFEQLVGRVVRRDIQPGEPIKEDDLLPIGARPGIVSGAAAGTVVLEADAERFSGIESLSVGDRLTIYERLPDTVRPSFAEHEWATIQGGQLSPTDAELQQTLRSGLHMVASGVVLLGQRGKSGSDEGDASDDATLVLAIPKALVVAVGQALASDNRLMVAAEATTLRRDPPGDTAPVAGFSGELNDSTVTDLVSTFRTQAEVAEPHTEGMIAVPVTARTIPPFTKLSPEDFVDPATGRLREFYFPADQVDPGWVLSVKDLIDRVSSEEIASGRAIADKNLLPAGTSPGLAAGVPAGYVAIEVTSFQIDGLAVPNVLDEIDLVASRPLDSEAAQSKSEWASERSGEIFFTPTAEDVYAQADTRIVSHGAILLSKQDREFETLVENEIETAADEVVIGADGANRRGVTRSSEPKILKRTGLACTLAVPVSDIPDLTEALSVQRLVGGNDGGTGAADEGEDAVDGDTVNEVLIYAVTHSSRPAVAPPAIPAVDLLSDWFERWSRQFQRFHQQAAASRTDVHRVEQIRGQTRTSATYIGQRPASEIEAIEIEQTKRLNSVLSTTP